MELKTINEIIDDLREIVKKEPGQPNDIMRVIEFSY
jgi:hypothetical protein